MNAKGERVLQFLSGVLSVGNWFWREMLYGSEQNVLENTGFNGIKYEIEEMRCIEDVLVDNIIIITVCDDIDTIFG